MSKVSPAVTLTNFETHKSILSFNCYCNFPLPAPSRKNVDLPGLPVKCIRPQKMLVMVSHLSNDHLAMVRLSYQAIKLAATSRSIWNTLSNLSMNYKEHWHKSIARSVHFLRAIPTRIHLEMIRPFTTSQLLHILNCNSLKNVETSNGY